jgi:TP901 family phage tail tape measure protein
LANIHSTITYNANLSAAQAQIKALTAQIGTLTAAFNTLDKSALTAQRSLASTFAAGVGQTGGFTTSTVKATSAVETFGKQLAANRLTMRQYFREAITGYANQSSMMRRLAEQQVRYQQSMAVPIGGGQTMMMTPQSINAASSAAALASQRFAVFNQLMNGGATAMLNWGKNTQWAGRQLMVGFTVPLMLFTAVASKQFRELDKELTRFQKVYGADLGNAISDSTSRMREQVKQLAYDISSTYGIAAKDTAALAADIAATGAEGEKLIASVQQTTRLAVLGEVDRQEAMKATLSLQSAFRMNTNELAESINFLNAVENQTSATLEDLATAIPKVGPVVRSLGGDVKDLATLLVAMREGGIPAAEAANALKSGLASLINPTKQASAVAKSFGVDLVGIVEANRGQLMPTIYAMQEALAGLDSFSRSRIIEQIFGKYQFARITALFDNIGRAGSQTQSVVELASKSSADLAKVANDELRTLTESTAMRFQRTMEDLKNAIMPIGQTLTETLIPIFEFIGSGMKTLTSFFQALPGPVKDFAKYGIAIAALAGPIIMMVGLFGNLISNVIKFGMMITRVGARIAGIKVEKFELLNQDVMAAKLGVEGLTKSFDTQEVALRRLTGVLTAYETSLRRLTTSNPALFIPGAIPPARGSMPIRRQAGSTGPEFVPGSGRGDKIPAMLEPGEFIVNRAATEKYAPVLMAMNRGNLPGFQEGAQLSHLTLSKQQSVGSLLQLPFLDQGARAMLMLIQSIHGVDFQVRTYSNAVVGLSTTLNQSMERGEASIELFRREISDTGTVFDPLKEQLRVLIAETGEFGNDMNLAEQAVNSFAQQMRAQAGGFKGRTFNAAQLESMTMAALAGVSDPRQRAALTRLLDTPTAFSAGRGLTASNMYLFGQAAGVPMYTAGEGSSRRIYANIGQDQYLGVRPKAERIPLGKIPTYQGAQQSPISFALPVGATPLSAQGTPTMYDESGRRITKSMARSMGGTQLELFQRQIQPSAEQFVDNLARVFATTLARVLESSSPSKRMDREVAKEGKNFGDGAASGFIKGYKSSAAGKPIVAGPVGGTGIESISNAQKIAQADQSIIKLKDMQLKHTADRVRADVELVALSRRYASGEINLIQFLEQKKQIELQKKDVSNKELRIQNLINQKKQAILDADQAQLRAEQEEAKNAQRRAVMSAAPMFGVGPSGSMGYFRGGTSPYATGGLSAAAFDRKVADIAKMAGPTSSLSNRPTGTTGPAIALGAAKDQAQAGMRGMNAMNAMFALSMVTSSISMMGGASSDAAAKIGLFTTALMTATMLMNSGLGKGAFTNFLGMRSLGGKLQNIGAARGVASSLQTGKLVGAGAGLFRAGSMVSMLGGPVGIAAGIGITAAITGFMMYRKAAEEARERAIAAFNDPVKSAEYFGETIMNVSDILEKNRLSNVSEDLQQIDKALREAVAQDYSPLIEQIKFLSAGAGAQQLSVAYSNMIISGMSAENAKATIEAIAAEAGRSGGEAFSEGLSQGLFDQEITIEDAINNVVGQFAPGETDIGRSGLSILETINKDIEETQRRIDEITASSYTPTSPTGSPGQTTYGVGSAQELEDLINKLDQLKDRLEDLTTVNPELLTGVIDSLVMAYQQDPTAAINGFEKLIEIINKLESSDREAAIGRLSDYLRNTYGEEWNTVLSTIDTAEETVVATQMAIAGISLDKAINDAGEFDIALGRAAVSAKSLADATKLLRIEAEESYFGMIDQFAQEQKDAANLRFENYSDAMDERIELYEGLKESAQDAFEVEQEGRQNSIEGMQEEMDVRRRDFDEQMQQLDDRREAIEKSSDAYIESLEKNQKAESFYAQQRKTAFGALEKLASGDVFGFLQEREQMSADAQEFSYDEMISGIEERRDLELEAIDEIREQKQKEQDEYEQMMEDRIKGVQDLMEIEQDAHDDRMEFYDKQIERANTAKENALEDKNQEIDGIKTMEQDYRNDAKAAEEKYSKDYAELKSKPYVEARKEMLRLRIEEIYYRGGVTLGEAVRQAGALAAPRGPKGVPMGVEAILQDLGLRGDPTWMYNSENVGDTGVGDTAQQVRDMTVDAESVTINGDIVGGSGGGSTPPTTNQGPWFAPDGTEYTWNGEKYVPAATGGYIQNGRLMLEGGGKVTGPGGPKSDVIPAYLSNGEYVIQASSVSKYGKDMMDHINAGKFADGGIVRARDGAYISADRAETAASGNRYLGGYKPKPSYSGGTPTYSGGYTSTNSQASSNIYGKKKFKNRGTPMRPVFGTPIPNAQDLARVSGYQENWFNTFLGDTWNSLLSGAAAAYSLTGLGGMRSLPTVRPNASNQLVMDEASQYNLSARLAGMSPEEYAKIPGNIRAMEAALFTSSFTPGLGIAAGAIASRGLRAATSIGRYQEKLAGLYGGSALASDTGGFSILKPKKSSKDPGFIDIDSDGSSLGSVVQYQGRTIAIADINGTKVPFYLSTGKGGKVLSTGEPSAGKWYPYGGHGYKGYFIKDKGYENYYFSTKLRETSEWLDNNLGEISPEEFKFINPANPGTINKNIGLTGKDWAEAAAGSSGRMQKLLRELEGDSFSTLSKVVSSLKNSRLVTEDKGSINIFGRKSLKDAPFEVPTGYELSVNRSLGTTVGSIYRNRSLTTYLNPEVMKSNEGLRLSAALSEHKERMRVESRFLGIPKNAPWTERPIYGYLRKPGTYEEGYGNVTLDINPNIANKVTTSLGDSFNEGFFARPENLNRTHTMPETKGMRELQIYADGQIPLDPSGIKRATLRLNDPWHNKVPSKEIHPESLSMQVKTLADAIEFVSKIKNVEIPSRVLFNGRPVSEFFLRKLHSRKILELRAATTRLKEQGYAYGGLVQKFADGGLVESINKFFPQGGHQFYPGWDRYKSWSGGKPGLIMMHHTAGNWGQGELDYFAKDWVGKPVVQGFIRKTGTAHTIAGGNTGWGAGPGSVERLKDIGQDQAAELISLAGGPTGTAWQIEVQSMGDTKDFTQGQFDAIARMSAAVRDWAGWPSFEGRIINHKDWTSRKPDTLYDRSVFINNANKIWEEGGGSTSGEEGKSSKSSDRKNKSGKTLADPARSLRGPLSLLGINENNTGKDGGGNQPDTTSSDGDVTFSNIPDGYTEQDANRTLGYVRAGGWPGNLQRIAWAIAMRESGGRNIYDTGDYGIFQLNKPSYGSQPWWTSDDKILNDPQYNSSVAFQHVSQRGTNFLPWAMRVANDGSYSWDWSYYSPRPSWADTTERRTTAFFNSWVQKRAAGGFISGPGGPRSDMIPAMLSNGEYVVKASAVAKYGKGFMDQVNSGSLNTFQGSSMQPARFANGGIVGSAQMPAFSMPEMADTSVGVNNTTYGGNSSSTRNSTKVKVVINGSGGKSANAIANKVISMINSANSRRNHSRSI